MPQRSAMHLQHDVVCPTLVGRGAQIDALRQVLAQAREGNGRVALIVGEAGVGKSRLLRAMTDEARAQGFFVLQGACFEAERSIPYAPLLDLVRLFASTASAAVVAHVLRPAANDLVSIFPELQPILPEATPSASVDPESDRRRLFHVLAQAITLLARTQPVFLAFEDVHWSDDATLELVFHLARTHAAQRVAIALTYRGEEAGPRLARLVADLERARIVSDLPIERLGRDDVGAMLRAIFPRQDLGSDFVHVLHGLTEGNPFFVEETLKSLIIAGDLTNFGKAEEMTSFLTALVRLRIPIVAVLGNHDHESGQQDELTRLMIAEGIKVLDGSSYVRDGVGFAGVKGFFGGFGRGVLTAFGEAPVKAFVQAGIDEILGLAPRQIQAGAAQAVTGHSRRHGNLLRHRPAPLS